MLCESIQLDDEGTAFLHTYCLDAQYSNSARRSWPAVVIVPGGGYLTSTTKEGEAVATQFLSHGFSCFVLRYSTYLRDWEGVSEGRPHTNQRAHYPAQELQLMQAMHLIHEHAAAWAIDERAIFTCGFSAGAHIAGTVATRWSDPSLTSRLPFVPQGEELKPAGSILGYPMLAGDLRAYYEQVRDVPGNLVWQGPLVFEALFGTTDPTPAQTEETDLLRYVGPHVPPMFVWHSIDDPVVDPVMTTRFVLALQQQGVLCEYHLYSNGGHGLACANEHYAESPSDVSPKIATWLPMAARWMGELAARG